MSRVRFASGIAIIAAALVSPMSCGTSTTGTQDTVNRVALSLGITTLSIGQTVQASAIVDDAAGTALSGITLSWSSSDPAVATISATGLITAISAGTTQITASAEGQSASVTIMVSPIPVASVSVSLGASSIPIGTTTQATATTRDANNNLLTGRVILWSSSNSAVATVNALTGVVTGAGLGTANIIATSEGITGSAAVTVQAGAVAAINVALGSVLLEPGQSTTATPTLRDASNNIITGQSVTWSSSNTGVATVTAAGSVTALAAGSASITATSGGVSGSATLTVQPGVGSVSVSLSPSSIAIGGQAQGTAVVKDPSGNVLTGRTVVWSSGNASVATVSAAGGVTGVASGSTSITATSEGQSASASINVAAPVANVSVSVTSPLFVGGTTQASVTLRDAGNNVLTGQMVTWSSSNPAIASVSSSGLVTGVAPGTISITANSGGQSGSAVLLVAAATQSGAFASQLSISTQPSASVQNGQAFAQQPVVQLVTGSNVAVGQAGVVVTASIASGGGSLGGTLTATTNGSGVATFTNLSISGAIGGRTLSFSASGLAGATSGTITITAGAASQLSITTQPSASVQTGVAFAQQPVIQLVDASNNAVSQAGVVVTAAIASGGGTLGGTATATTNGSGVATFTNLSVTGSGAQTLLFTASGLTSATSTSLTVAAIVATQLSVTTQPSVSAQSGVAFAQQPAIQLLSGSSSPVSSAGVVVTATIASGGGTLGGTAMATTNGSGVATFTNLAISGTIGARTLSFSASGLSGATSGTITITAGAASQLSITTQPSASVQTGVAFAQQPVIQLVDASNNAVSQAGVVVTAAIASGGGTLGGTATATTNGSGVATFTNLSVTGSGTQALLFTASGLTSATSTSLTVAAIVATQLSVTTQPSVSAQSGVAFAQQPVIQLRDGSNNAVSQAGVVVTAAIASGGGTLGGTVTATTNGSGVATFTNLAITGTVGARTLSFSASGLTGVTSGTVTVSAGTASLLLITTQPSASVQSGVAFPQQPVVQLVDGSNNSVSQAGIVVTAAIASGGGTLGGTATATTNSSGVATFTSLSVTGSGAQTLIFTASGLTSATSISIAITSPTRLSITTPLSGGAATGSFLPGVSVAVLNASNALVTTSSAPVTAAIASGTGTLSGATIVNAVNGVATFVNLTITGTGSFTLVFTSPGLTSATTSSFTVSAAFAAPSLISANFDNGTVGSFLNDTPGSITFPADPTGSGRGDVASMQYSCSTTLCDINKELEYDPPTSIGLGASFFYGGDLYFPANIYNFGTTNPSLGAVFPTDVQRKLVYYRTTPSEDPNGQLAIFFFLKLLGQDLVAEWSQNGGDAADTTSGAALGQSGQAQLSPGQWYRIETQITMNSSMGSSDGIIRVWVNGNLIYNRTNASFTNASWTSTPFWATWYVGDQREGADLGQATDLSDGSSINEFRYWDNIAFSSTRVGPGAFPPSGAFRRRPPSPLP